MLWASRYRSRGDRRYGSMNVLPWDMWVDASLLRNEFRNSNIGWHYADPSIWHKSKCRYPIEIQNHPCIPRERSNDKTRILTFVRQRRKSWYCRLSYHHRTHKIRAFYWMLLPMLRLVCWLSSHPQYLHHGPFPDKGESSFRSMG